MSRQFFVIAAFVLIACVSAFHSPVQVGRGKYILKKIKFHHNGKNNLTKFSYCKVAARAVTVTKMSAADVAVSATNALSQFSQTVAFETDFGGNTYFDKRFSSCQKV